jgi:ABC-type sulfate/molybdate transport systems ATPase subunit
LIGSIIRQRQLTALIVTHDMDQAARLANRVMRMDQGRPTRIGRTEEVLHA